MENELEFTGAALATTFMVRALATLLVDKGILSRDEWLELLDQTQLLMERQQNYDVPANAQVWQIGRRFLDHLAARPKPRAIPSQRLQPEHRLDFVRRSHLLSSGHHRQRTDLP